jgi:photosystem II stability/assembly factor-like uncharacterized protein
LYNLEEIQPGMFNAVGEDGEVLRSTDNGSTWEAKTATGAFRLLEQFWHDPQNGYVVGEYQGRLTTDGGGTWELIPGFDEWEPFTHVTFLSDLHGYLLGDFSTWETFDGGATWNETIHLLEAPIYQRQVILYDGLHRLVTTGLEGAQLWETFDNGENWTMIHERVSTSGFPDIVQLPGGRLLMVSSDGDLTRSDDAGETWTNATSSFGGDERVDFEALASLSGGVVLAGGSPFQFAPNPMLWLRSSDNGYTWNELASPPSMTHVYDMDNFGSAFVVAAGRDGFVERVSVSLDGGLSWTNGELETEGLISDVTVPSADVAFALTRSSSDAQVWRTTDQGQSWHGRDTGLPPTENLFDVFFVDEETGFVCGGASSNAILYRTTDGGGMWEPAGTTGLQQTTLRSMHWIDEMTGILATYYRIYRTTDGGDTWVEVDEIDGADVIHFRDDLHGVLKDYGEETLRVTDDGGMTWQQIDLPFPGPYGGLIAMPTGFFLGGLGSVILSAADLDATGVDELSYAPVRILLGQTYPNPFRAGTTVRYTVAETSPIRLLVYDPRGRLVRRLADRIHAAGSYASFWDGCDNSGRALPAGVYFLRLTDGVGKQMQARRVSLVR